MPLISILLPVKNTEKYLPACLNSILAQSISDWELIAVNDHSTDDSAAILKAYAQKDQRIKVLDNKDAGIIAALRLAYQESSGTYITRMDSDDKMAVEKLAMLLNALSKGSSSRLTKSPRLGKSTSTPVNFEATGRLAIGQVQYFSAEQLGAGYQKYEQWLNQLSSQGNNFQEIYKECVIPSPCWMVHRQDLDRCGAFEPNLYPEDYDLCFRFYQHGLTIVPSNTVLHYWRDYPNRTSRTDAHYSDNRFLAIKMLYFLQLDFQDGRPLVLWGAGKKGKWIAQYLIAQKIPFQWVCNNPKKIGRDIYGQVLRDANQLTAMNKAHFIVAVANEAAQQEIYRVLESVGILGKDFFFFC